MFETRHGILNCNGSKLLPYSVYLFIYLQPYFKYQNFIQLTTSWLENNKIENDVHKLSNLTLDIHS